MVESDFSRTSLQQILPWSVKDPRCIVVYDSLESDGRFLTCTMATQVLTDPVGMVLWVSFGPFTQELVLSALRKRGWSDRSAKSQSDSASSRIRIRCIPAEVADKMVAIPPIGDGPEDTEVVVEEIIDMFVKRLYTEIHNWMSDTPAGGWVILDDMSCGAGIIGTKRISKLVHSLIASRPEHVGLLVRCSLEEDQKQTIMSSTSATNNLRFSEERAWVGAGGKVTRQDSSNSEYIWERALVEVVDAVVDVFPLSSGYTRQAHGKLVFTECTSGGFGGRVIAPVYNYCLMDNDVSAIRILN